MTDTDKPNPFAVLRLPTDATAEQIVRRGQEQTGTTSDDARRQLVEWAIEALITHPPTRALHELFELPDTGYDVDEEWERFVRVHRRNPARPGEVTPSAAAGAFDFVALVDAVVEDLRRLPEADIAAALAVPPVAPSPGPPPLEVWDVLFG